jgi:cytochrome c peroxidase
MRRLGTLSGLALAVALGACADRELTTPAAPDVKKTDTPQPSEEVIALGRAIFFDENLSLNGNQSCASCHDPDWGWTGPNASVNAEGAVYEGSIEDAFGGRKPPTSAYATLSPIFHFDGTLFVGGNFWDGRATGERLGNPAAEQALGPFLNPVEQALASPADVISRICAGSYVDLVEAVWPDEFCDDPDYVAEAYDQVGLAIAAFEGSPESNAFTSKYDQSLRGGVKLTKEERRGLALFKGQGKCTKCHTLGKGNQPALFTDFTFDNLGIPENPANPQYPAQDPGLGGFLAGLEETQPDWADMADDFWGMHKVPTLRNVDLRPGPEAVKAYGHNGYFKTLWEIVHFYNTRDVKPVCAGAFTSAEAIAANCWPAPEIAENVNTAELGDLGLSFDDEMAIVTFLKTLSDGF